MQKRTPDLLFALLLLLSQTAFAGDFRIVPGQRIGSVALGMSRNAVQQRLHTPNKVLREKNGLLLETWLSHSGISQSAREHGNYLKHDYLTVFFRHNRAVQIEASAPQFQTSSGLSTHSSTEAFSKRYPKFQTPHFANNPALHWNGVWFSESAVDPDGSSPAAKHFVFYGDALQQGIAWKYGAWGDLAPEPETDRQEAVVIHQPGRGVLLNPNDGLPYAGTAPTRTDTEQ